MNVAEKKFFIIIYKDINVSNCFFIQSPIVFSISSFLYEENHSLFLESIQGYHWTRRYKNSYSFDIEFSFVFLCETIQFV